VGWFTKSVDHDSSHEIGILVNDITMEYPMKIVMVYVIMLKCRTCDYCQEY